MRLQELITEAISLTYLNQPLKDVAKEQILKCLNNDFNDISSAIPHDVEQTVRDNGSLSALIPIIKRTLITKLSYRIQRAYESLIRSAANGMYVNIDLKGKTTANGYADGLTVGLNEKFINNICQSIIDILYQDVVNNLQNEEDLYDDFFNELKYANKKIFESGNIDQAIMKMNSTLIHELVHIAQHLPQITTKRRSKTEYRSYLEKDKSKFNAALRRIASGDHSPEDYKIYRGSPQELAAFAHQTVLELIETSGIDDQHYNNLRDLAYYKETLLSSVGWYIDKRFHSPDNPAESKIFKRFYRLVYQEVVRYIERLEQKITNKMSTEKDLQATQDMTDMHDF